MSNAHNPCTPNDEWDDLVSAILVELAHAILQSRLLDTYNDTRNPLLVPLSEKNRELGQVAERTTVLLQEKLMEAYIGRVAL